MTRKKNVIESTVDKTIEAEVVDAQPVKEEITPQERINGCNIEMTEILKKYNCDLFVSMVLEPPNNIRPLIRIIPKP